MQRTVVVASLALAGLLVARAARADEALSLRKLDNGLDVLVVEKHDVPIVTIEVAVRAGSFIEDRETTGLSHLYEHMFFKGNAAIPTQEAYMKKMQELGIKFNGTTGTERVNYFITLPSRNFTAGMKFMSDALLTPFFNEEELVNERRVVIGEYDRNESSPEYFLRTGVAQAAWGDDFVRKNPLGVREVILRATRETMVKFKNTYYVPNNSIVSIVGDVNATEARALADRYFGVSAWKEAANPFENPRPPLARLAASKAVVVTKDKANPSFAAFWNGPDTDRDTVATYVADVWGTLLAMPHGRFQKTFKDGGLATRTSLVYFTQRHGGELHFNATLRETPFKVRDALLAEIAAMVDDPAYFSKEDLALAKRQLLIDRTYEGQSGEQLSHTLTTQWASTSIDYHRTYLDETDRVTLEDIRGFVANYLVARPYVIGCLMDPDEAKEKELDEKSLLGAPPEQQGKNGAGAVQAFKLSNGVRAIVRHEPGCQVGALEILLDGGAAFLTKETQGVERLALAAALEHSKSRGRDETKRALEELGARTGHESNHDFSRVGVQAPMKGFASAVDLVVECLKDPAFEKAAFEQKRDEILDGLRREKQRPDAYLWRLTDSVFYAGHAYENRPDGTLETVKTFDADACRKALAAALTPARTVVVLVSSLPHAEAKALIEKELGWIHDSPQPARTALSPVAPTERAAFEARKIATTYVGGRFPAPAPSDPGYAAAKVLLSILHERLWDAIRTKRSLSYAPQAGLSTRRTNYGVVYVTSTEPAKCVEVMFDEMRRMKDELVSPADIQGFLAGDMTARAQRSESSAAHAQALGRAELIAGGWRHHYDEQADLARVTPEQVREAARTLLKDIRWGVLGPKAIDERLLAGETRTETSAPR